MSKAGENFTWGALDPPPNSGRGGCGKGLQGPQAYFLNASICKFWLQLAYGGGGDVLERLTITGGAPPPPPRFEWHRDSDTDRDCDGASGFVMEYEPALGAPLQGGPPGGGCQRGSKPSPPQINFSGAQTTAREFVRAWMGGC